MDYTLPPYLSLTHARTTTTSYTHCFNTLFHSAASGLYCHFACIVCDIPSALSSLSKVDRLSHSDNCSESDEHNQSFSSSTSHGPAINSTHTTTARISTGTALIHWHTMSLSSALLSGAWSLTNSAPSLSVSFFISYLPSPPSSSLNQLFFSLPLANSITQTTL